VPLSVNRQAILLEVVYEDAHLLVVNKQAGLMVHPSPGHASGTLVNALLHHCRLPAMRVVPRFAGGLESAAASGAPTLRAD
jgi:23S rRNA pseudouridine1911/1915/1917 synthase